MNTHSLNETLRQFLADAFPTLAIHTPLNNGELKVPYVLISATADDELIARNNTWNLTLTVEVHSSAFDHPDSESREWATAVFQMLAQARSSLNALAEDFVLYSILLTSIEEPSVKDNDFVQRAAFKVIAQY